MRGNPPGPLTVAIDGEGRPGAGDLVVADLAVLGRAVLVGGLHLQDVVINLALGHCRPVLALPKHRGELVHVVDLDVHGRPADRRGMHVSGMFSTAGAGSSELIRLVGLFPTLLRRHGTNGQRGARSSPLITAT